MKRPILMVLAFVVGAALAIPAVAGQQAGEMTLEMKAAALHFKSRGYSPYADRGFPTRPLWGDTHLHTANSPDAFAFGNLDRIQIIKGWLDKKGKTREKVYNVVWGDAERRKPDKKGKLPLVGNTVDVENATWTNTIGDPELIAVWKDPDFDPKLNAFYYARVIEIPTPRWTAYDAKRFGVKISKEVPMTTQERAYTSPIWYTP